MVDGLVEDIRVGECLVGQMMSLKVTPDDLDVVEFKRIFWQPLDDEPMGSLSESCRGRLADVDWAIVEHYDNRLDGAPQVWGHTRDRALAGVR
jgi:hypothetical protein